MLIFLVLEGSIDDKSRMDFKCLNGRVVTL